MITSCRRELRSHWETGTSAFYVARLLAALQLEPVVVDAHEVRRKASRPAQKSDRRDALGAVRRRPPGILSGGRAHPQPGDQYAAHHPVPAAALPHSGYI
jgi:hypothetical protein